MKFSDNKDLGILIFRIGIGIAFMVHGYPKITGGVEKWTVLGEAVFHLGIHFYPAFWGLMAAIAEFGGGLLLATGVFFRTALAGLFFTMFVAVFMKISKGMEFKEYAHALEMAIVFLSFFFIGAGKYRLKIGIR